jgi:YgiT-type zinc finger domain-containing protein
MREKKWKDCPVCGAKDTMKKKSGITETVTPKGYEKITIKNLDGQFCEKCGEGFWSIKSNRKVNSVIAEGMALQDSKKTLVCDVIDHAQVAKELGVTRARVGQMIAEGKLKYVFIGANTFVKKPILTKTTTKT